MFIKRKNSKSNCTIVDKRPSENAIQPHQPDPFKKNLPTRIAYRNRVLLKSVV